MLHRLRRFEVAGVVVAVRADDPAPARELLTRLGRLAPAAGRVALRYDLLLRPARKRLVRNGRSLWAGRSARDVVDALELDLLLSLAARAAPTPLHAAALAVGGQGLLLAGPSGSGKSTLARELVGRGARYLGDEHAFLDDALRARGLPRAILADAPGGLAAAPLVPSRQATEQGAVPVCLAVLLRTPRTAGAPLLRLSPAEATAHLAAAIYRRPRPEDLARVARLAGAVPAVALACEGPAAAVDLLLAALPPAG